MRETLRKLFRGSDAKPAQSTPAPDRVDYSYRVFWTKQARSWDAARRRSILAATRTLTASETFNPNVFERRYQVEGMDGEHSGASLLALIQVLEAFDAAE